MPIAPQPASLDEVPSYQKLMLPVLELAADNAVHSTSDAFDPIALKIGLSENGKQATLPDGRNRLKHRLEWARTYLKKAGLLEYPRRGTFQITARGKQMLSRKLSEINKEVLSEFPEFREFVNSSREELPIVRPSAEDIDPEEAFENAHVALRKSLEDELLEKVKAAKPAFLEQLVIDLLLAMGYGGSRKDAGRALGKTGDGGIDGIINEDALGLDVVYVQAKRWSATVGRPEIQAFVGALQGNRARKGVFITTSTFSKDAQEYIHKIDARVVLIDGPKLAGLMADHNIGVTNGRQYTIKKIDGDYFSEE